MKNQSKANELQLTYKFSQLAKNFRSDLDSNKLHKSEVMQQALSTRLMPL